MAALPTFATNGHPTAAQLTSLLPTRAAKPSDTVLASTVALTNDPDLLLAVAANAEYEVTALLKYAAAGGSGTGQFKIGWTAPTSATFDWLGHGLVVNGTSGTTGSIAMDASIVTDPRSYGAAGTGTSCMVRVTGRLVTFGTAGTLQLQWAQVVSSATGTTVKAGSYLVVRQIA